MAIQNSIEQIMLPGFANLVSEEIETAITNNPTLGAIEQNLLAAGSIEEVKTKIEAIGTAAEPIAGLNPYPTVGFWDNRDNNPYYAIYDSEFGQITSARASNDGTLHSDRTGENYTNGNIGSGSQSSSYSVQGCNWASADAHGMIEINEGYLNYHGVDASFMSWFRHWGVVIGKQGKRQPISIWQNGDEFRIGPRGSTSWYDRITNVNSSTYSTWFNGTSYGMIGYNERTSTLVAMEAKDSNNNYRMHIWQHTGRNLNDDEYKAGTLHLFLSEAKSGNSAVEGSILSYEYYDFQWSSGSSNSYNESRYRMRVIPGDNGVIGLSRMVPSNRTEYATFANGVLDTDYTSMGLTTSYGTGQGVEYGMRHNITWDNEIIACYNPYYYYHAGFMAYFIDTKDPRNYLRGEFSNTSWGCQIAPFGKSKFLFYYTAHNTDSGDGFEPYTIDPKGVFKNNRDYNGGLTNGGNLSLTALQERHRFASYYTSTNYPVMVPMSHWKVSK